MTNKDWLHLKFVSLFIIGLFAGLFIGSLITSLRYDSEIRTDQLRLKGQIEEIVEDRAVVTDLISELLSQVEQVKAERRALEKLKILLGKGE